VSNKKTKKPAQPPPPKRTLLEQYLPIVCQIAGRIAMSEDRLREIVGSRPQTVRAFNLADGSLTQMEIARKVGMSQGALSERFTKWIAHGAAFELDGRFIHLYPLADAPKAKKGKR
jgi:hypothetical protein